MIGTPIRVLVVDDDPIAVEIILEYLDGMQVEATTAHDGQAGWEALEARPGEFDVVLLDRMMPRLNGIQLLQRIRADVRFGDPADQRL